MGEVGGKFDANFELKARDKSERASEREERNNREK